MKLITSDEMRRLDRQTIEDLGVPGTELMLRAGEGVADLVLALADRHGLTEPTVHLFAGRGNNGGDAYVVACALHEQDITVKMWLACRITDVKGDARTHLNRMIDAGVEYRELPDPDDWVDAVPDFVGADILVDGLLGIGLSQPPRGPVAAAISTINAMSEQAWTVAIDVPSGLNADTGETLGVAVRADLTATMAFPKLGMITDNGVAQCGLIEVVDIGIPDEYAARIESTLEMITVDDVLELMPRRKAGAHKGTYGHVLIVAGAAGFTGAPVLAARAALRSGAGLVSVLVPQSLVAQVAASCPEAMVHGGDENAEGSLSAEALRSRIEWLKSFSACVMGPGMTAGEGTRALVDTLLKEFSGPLLLDADALNALNGDLLSLKARTKPLVLTPHPGEMAGLMKTAVPAVQKNRLETAQACATQAAAVVALKGAGTIVASPGGECAVNTSGNPGMACGGSGDVLSGLLGGLLAQGHDVAAATRAAVHLHGRAGDIAAAALTMVAMTAGDISDHLPDALRELGVR